jgi:inner membrane protein
MPTILTHAVAGAAIAQVLAPRSLLGKLTLYSAVLAMVPDADVIGFPLGIDYGDMLGHRGLTHSLLFAALAGIALPIARKNWRAGVCLALATASHGVLDAFTNGGLGVAFFAPFASQRYFFPVTPIRVSPIGLGFFSGRGVAVLASEIQWVWIASAVVFLAAWRARRSAGAPAQ